jgi:thiamine-monophosphate kinase
LLHERYDLRAGMDISDGLALDASRLAAASGCGAALEPGAIPISPDAERLAEKSGHSALEHALSDGEDFELLLAASPETAERLLRDQPLDVPLTCVGRCVAAPGLWQVDDVGALRPLAATGYQHLSAPGP